MSKQASKTDMEWKAECVYIAEVTHKLGDVKEMNFDCATFVRYCEMQQQSAERDGQYDAAEYIGHCIDDLLDAMPEYWSDIAAALAALDQKR
jgi:hypothetical protein